MSDNLKQKMIGALAWSSVDRFGQQAVQIIIGMILARLLSVEDYDIIALVIIFVSFSYVLVDSGFAQALIRKQDATETDYNSVFYFNISISVVLYVIFYFASPYIAVFFNNPQIRDVIRIILFAVIFNALYLIPFAKLSKAMDFKTMAKINIFATLGSGIVGVSLAFLDFNFWALVFQQISFHFFRMIFSVFFVRWKPSKTFSFSSIRSFSKFSAALLGTSMLNVLFNNIYVIILGKFYPKKEVGYYYQGNKLSETVNFTFQAILSGSSYSLFSKIQGDNERFVRVFRELARKTSLISFPLILGLIAAAEPLIEIAWSEKFLPSAPYFQLLCLASLFNPIYTLNMSALNASGHSKATFRIEMIKKAMIALSIAITFQFGVISMLWGLVVSSFVAFAISAFLLKKNIKHFIKHQISDFFESIFLGAIICVTLYLVGLLNIHTFALLPLQVIVAGTIYISAIKLRHRELYNNSLTFMKDKIAQFTNRR